MKSVLHSLTSRHLFQKHSYNLYSYSSPLVRNFLRFQTNSSTLPNRVISSVYKPIDPNNSEINITTSSNVSVEPEKRVKRGNGKNGSSNKNQQNLLQWETPPRNVLITKKPYSKKTTSAFVELSHWLHQKYPEMNIIVHREVVDEIADLLPPYYVVDDTNEYSRIVDLVITLGGDGTILHASSLFQKDVPPIISFSMGTLGFLLPFDFSGYKRALTGVIEGKSSYLSRMRLECLINRKSEPQIKQQALNEITLHRGRNPSLATISCYIDNEYLTDAISDGLIVSTPTGSTAYNLSAGGPLLHPLVPGIILNPISPRSLSFRPLVLHQNAYIKMVVSKRSGNGVGVVEAGVDGMEVAHLSTGDEVIVRMSEYATPCITRIESSVDWVRDLNRQLKWNQNFTGLGSVRHLDVDNKD
ncbi:NADH kinase pos5 [Nowakowskiella sp. JEL0407]|nr:NADH kinase pos5 [Nowakowskiella sp. JEL0407]